MRFLSLRSLTAFVSLCFVSHFTLYSEASALLLLRSVNASVLTSQNTLLIAVSSVCLNLKLLLTLNNNQLFLSFFYYCFCWKTISFFSLSHKILLLLFTHFFSAKKFSVSIRFISPNNYLLSEFQFHLLFSNISEELTNAVFSKEPNFLKRSSANPISLKSNNTPKMPVVLFPHIQQQYIFIITLLY